MHSDATTVSEYVDSLAEPRRTEVRRTLDFVRTALPEGLEEAMDYGMITWSVPLDVEPSTYNGKPLMFAGLASQKNHISLYLMTLYSGAAISEDEFRARWAGAKRLNLGKSCIRYVTVDDLDVGLIQEVLQTASMPEFIAAHNQVRAQRRST